MAQFIEDLQAQEDLSRESIISPDMAGASNYYSFVANREREKSAADAEWYQNLAAHGMSFRALNGAANIWDWVEFDGYNALRNVWDEDKAFKDNWSLDAQMRYLDTNNLAMKYLPRVAKANSQEGLALITKGIHQDDAIDDYINKNITGGWQASAAIAGAIFDLDIAIPFSKVRKAKSVLENIRTPLAAQAAWEATHSMMNDDYTASDAVLGFAGMSLFVAGMTKYQLNKMNKITAGYSNTFPDVPYSSRIGAETPTAAQRLEIEELKFINNPSEAGAHVEDFLQTYKWSAVDAKASKAADDIELGATRTAEEIEEGVVYKDPTDTGTFNTQLGDLIKKASSSDIKSIDNMIEEVTNILENVKLGHGVEGATDIEKEVNGLLRLIRKESKETAFQLEDIVEVKMTKQPDGTYRLKTKNGKTFGKPVAAAVVVGLGATGAQAGDSEVTASTIGSGIMMLAIGLGGTMAIRAWMKNGGSMSKVVGRVKANIDASMRSVDVATKNKIVGNVQQSSAVLRTRLTETYQRFADAGGVAVDMADKLLVNFANGLVHSAEITKRRFARIAEANVAKVEQDEFKKWLEAQGMGYHPVVNFVENNKQLHRFREEITDAIDGGTGATTVSPHAQNVAKTFREEMKKLYDELVAADVKGYREIVLEDGTKIPAIKFTEDYIPRYWQTADMRAMISSGGSTNKNRIAIHKAIAEMRYSALQKSFPEKLQKWIDDGKKGKEPKPPIMKDAESDANSILKAVEGEMVGARGRVNDLSVARIEKQMELEGIEMSDAVRRQLEIEADKTFRAMHRMDLDYTAFKPFKILEEGREVEVPLSRLMDRDSHSIMSRYANEQGGNIALGKAGYPTVQAARTNAGKITDLELREDMNLVIDSLAGEDLVGMTTRQRQMYEVMTGVAFIGKLPLVTVSMLTEYAKILTTKSGFHSLMNQIVEGALGKYPKHSMLMDELSMATGQGTASLRHEVNPKGLDDISNIADNQASAFTGTIGRVSDVVRQGKEGASRFYGLLRFSDFLQRHALVTNTQVLSEMIYKGRKMSPTRMQQYGITPEILEDFKKSGLLGADEASGYVNKLEWDKFTPKQRDEFVNITFRMGQNLTQETTLGGTALYMHNDYMFKSLSYLLTFPAEAFANHGLRDITTMDNEAFRSMFSMYMGGYMSLKIRYALENKEVTDEEVAYRALVGMPLFGAIGTATGISDPVVLAFFQNMAELVKLSNYEDVVVGDGNEYD